MAHSRSFNPPPHRTSRLSPLWVWLILVLLLVIAIRSHHPVLIILAASALGIQYSLEKKRHRIRKKQLHGWQRMRRRESSIEVETVDLNTNAPNTKRITRK